MDQLEAQHGDGGDEGTVGAGTPVLPPVLPVRRLQLGLVPPAHLQQLLQGEAPGEGGEEGGCEVVKGRMAREERLVG